MTVDDSSAEHEYQPRQTEDMSNRAFVLGEGRISGYLSLGLGAMSLLAVLCFRYPEYLTTAELRAAYDPLLLQRVLMYSMWTAMGFGVLTFGLGRRKRMGAAGILLTLAAFALGGYRLDTGPVEPSAVSLGMD